MQLSKQAQRSQINRKIQWETESTEEGSINFMSTLFFKLQNQFLEIQASLKVTELHIKLPNSLHVIKIGFWTTFQTFALQQGKKGFIIRNNSVEFFIFYTQNQQQITRWKSKFSKIGIIKEFYEDFKPIKKIGAGKSSSVFLAKRRGTQDKYAVKAFSKNVMKEDPLSFKALQNEINMLRKLNSPNIIKFEAIYQTEKSFYLITEYIQGKTLRNWLENEQIKYYDTIKIIKGLLQGLIHLQSRGISHRDLKPENILVEEGFKRIVIVDFGLATMFKQPGKHLYRHCGTPGFIAPQILSENSYQVSPQSDVFSLGIIIHLMVLKKFPYKNVTAENIIQQNKEAIFSFQESQYSKIPAQIKCLLQSMLMRNYKLRISAKQVLNILQQKQKIRSYGSELRFRGSNLSIKKKKIKPNEVLKTLNRSNSVKALSKNKQRMGL